MALCVQLAEKLQQYRTYVDGISFDDVADAPSELKSRWQQLIQFEETFEASYVYVYLLKRSELLLFCIYLFK